MSRYSDPNSFSWSEPIVLTGLNVTKVPDKPGFYVVTDFSGKLQPSLRPQRTVFYVGQTMNLRRRLREHSEGRGVAGGRLSFQTLVSLSQGRSLYVRWAADERASIEADLINQLQAVHNDRQSDWS